ncbi:Mth938-like domain-containing protein [Magnetospirillum sp. 15-1]|uniref:Mth938-like domain-containing protein n=1 Tax=Magnetospirillum sp. 15-1 TaxID=1979370 RepID=UPI000BBCA399|nr:Mth938-like domain-containing protein [Magnetospirillum sp. 15-1]
MDITPLIPTGKQIVKGYGDGGFTIAGIRWEGSVLVLPDRTRSWAPAELAQVTEDSLAPLLGMEEKPRILLLGCGRRMAPVPAALRAALRAAGITLELMDTGGACRTFNVLVSEDRSVAAALIAV